MRQRVAVVAVTFAATVSLGASAAAAQSLWRDGAPGASLYADHRARGVDDVVTILISEQSSSSRSASTETSKDSTRTAGVSKFPTIFDPVAKKFVRPLAKGAIGYEEPSQMIQKGLNLDLSASAAHEGRGSIERADRVTGQIAARVVKVLGNGNLVVEGRRAVLVNGETQTMTISGVVRPQDISAANTIASGQVADAEIQLVGNGLLADTQRPGIIFRVLDWLRLF